MSEGMSATPCWRFLDVRPFRWLKMSPPGEDWTGAFLKNLDAIRQCVGEVVPQRLVAKDLHIVGGAGGVVSRGVQRRSHGKFPSGEGCRRSRRGGLPSVCRNVTTRVLTAGSRAPLLPRPPQGDLPPNTPTAPRLVAGVPTSAGSPSQPPPRPGYLPHLAAGPPSRQSPALLKHPHRFASFRCDGEERSPFFATTSPTATDTPTGSSTRVR